MLRKSLLFLLFTLLIASPAKAQRNAAFFNGPRILAFSDGLNAKVQVKVLNGTYTLKAYTPDSTFEMTYEREDVHPTYTFDGSLRMNKVEADSIRIFTTDTFVMRARKDEGGWTEERYYIGELTLVNGLLYVDVLVKVPLQAYLTGVCEAEGGQSPEFAYHQAQSILARTWLWTNLTKHAKDGYHIKDDQSSQAFKGIAHGPNSKVIAQAVASTGDTLAMHAGAPIIGFYHSNSGGTTVLPQHVWSQELPYCHSVLDPFSSKGSKYSWELAIPLQRWTDYWATQGVQWTAEQWAAFATSLPSERQSHWTIGDKTFKLETVRRALKLRSTYFSLEFKPDEVLLHGKGFGHGVGMSQQGAMFMAGAGFTWSDILGFYFKDLNYRSAASL